MVYMERARAIKCIAKIKMKLDTPLYDKNGIRLAEYLKRGEEHDVLEITENKVVLSNGAVVHLEENNPPDLVYGKLFINMDEIATLSRNAAILRRLQLGQELRILDVLKIDGVLLYKINDHELVRHQEGVIVHLFADQQEELS